MTLRSLILLAATLAACPSPSETPAPAPADEPSQDEGKDSEQAVDAAAFKPLPEVQVHFVEPADAASLTSPVKLVFGVSGAEVKPAGELVQGTGHHHVIINGEPTPQGQVVPADETHIHYGKGQTEAELELEPGEHTLTMQFADGMHRSYGPSASATIKVTVTD